MKIFLFPTYFLLVTLIDFQLQMTLVESFSKGYLGTPLLAINAANLDKIAKIGEKTEEIFFCQIYLSAIARNTDFFVRNLMSEI